MSLGQLEMSVPAADGLILKGTLKYPAKYAGIAFLSSSWLISTPPLGTATPRLSPTSSTVLRHSLSIGSPSNSEDLWSRTPRVLRPKPSWHL